MSKKYASIYLLSPVPKEGTIHLPMIDFSLLSGALDFSLCDTLMFTSKQAVRSADALNPEWKTCPCIAIGSATASEIESLGGSVIYQPKSFYATALSRDISAFFKDKHILYLRPKKVSFDAKAYLAKEGIFLQEQIIYETSCVFYEADRKPEQNAIIIFTSPSSIDCFFKNFAWDESYTAVVIGEATKIHLPKNVHYVVADEPLIEACIKKAEEILLTSNSK